MQVDFSLFLRNKKLTYFNSFITHWDSSVCFLRPHTLQLSVFIFWSFRSLTLSFSVITFQLIIPPSSIIHKERWQNIKFFVLLEFWIAIKVLSIMLIFSTRSFFFFWSVKFLFPGLDPPLPACGCRFDLSSVIIIHLLLKGLMSLMMISNYNCYSNLSPNAQVM